MRLTSLQVALALLVLLISTGGAGAFAQGDAVGEVYVYTNADLAAFEPLPTQDAPLVEPALGWDDVQDFIADHFDRLRADRLFLLERTLAEGSLERPQPHYGLALAPWWPRGPGKSRGRRVSAKHQTDFVDCMVPLHARTAPNALPGPPRTGNGADAIPSRGRVTRGVGRPGVHPAGGSARARASAPR